MKIVGGVFTLFEVIEYCMKGFNLLLLSVVVNKLKSSKVEGKNDHSQENTQFKQASNTWNISQL